MARLTSGIDPYNHLGGFLAEEVMPSVEDYWDKLSEMGYDLQNMSMEERNSALQDALKAGASDFGTAAVAGWGGIGQLMTSGKDSEDAANMVQGLMESPHQVQPTTPEGQTLYDYAGHLGKPIAEFAGATGDAAMNVTGSALLAAGSEVLAGTIGGKGGKGGKPNTPKTKSIVVDGEKRPRPKLMTDVPDLRGRDVDEAIAIARQEPHLIESGAAGEGKFTGGPRTFQSKRALTNQRAKLDAIVKEGAEGGDWYERYRDAVNEVTGSNPRDATWMSNLEGQFSAGVDPGSELAFSIKDTNSAIANSGVPVKAARPAQKKASMRAIEANDPSLFQLGPKTGEYARRVNPASRGQRTATGVNDFRHARNLGYTEKTGEPQRGGLGSTQHTYSDYETALAVDRANSSKLMGRGDWTGEQIQASPWVQQKANDLYEKRKKYFTQQAEIMMERNPGTNMPVEMIAKDLAFKEANKTIGDSFEKHTAFATHEQQPFVDAGHLPRLADASEAERAAFANDPRGSWDVGGRDAMYSGARLGDTGYAMRVRPSQDMQGAYRPPGGELEFNQGKLARPLVGFNTLKGSGNKEIAGADEQLLNLGEAIRSAFDVQGAGAWHKPWLGGDVGKSRSTSISRDPRPSDPAEISGVMDIAKDYGYPDVVDTGSGFTLTDFENTPPAIPKKKLKELVDDIDDFLDDPTVKVERSKIDTGYLGYEQEWRSGGVAEKLVKIIDKMPEGVVKAFDNNPYIPEIAARKLERDAEFAPKYGVNRQDVQNFRKIFADGPGWVGRLKKGLSEGAILPALAAAILGGAMQDEQLAESD